MHVESCSRQPLYTQASKMPQQEGIGRHVQMWGCHPDVVHRSAVSLRSWMAATWSNAMP